MTEVNLTKMTLPLTVLIIPLTAFGGWWMTQQADAIEQLHQEVRTNRQNLVTQQLEVNQAIGSLNTRQAVMAQNINSIRETLERLEKKIDRE